MHKKANLIKGDSPDIIDTNIKSLTDCGCSREHATHLALRYAKKAKSAEKAASSVANKKNPTQVVISK